MIRKAFRLIPTLAVLFCVAGPWATNAKAQGSRKDDVVFNSRGQPQAGATVRVCASNATTTSPCTPLASIYSDLGLTQALANPITADGMGNFSFYAAPGRYVIEFSGPSITTYQMRDVILPTDPSQASSSALSGFSLTLSGGLTVGGNAAVTGTLNVGGSPVPSTSQANTWTAAQNFNAPVTILNSGGNVAQKYACSSGNIQYVDSVNGNDSNDGCSPGTAKQYVSTAWVALYTANTACSGDGNNSCGGTIFTTDGSSGTIYWDSGHHTARIIGPNDPNAAWGTTCGHSHATCVISGNTWYSQLNGVHVVGIGCGSGGTGNGEKPKCNYAFGVGDSSGVGLDISGTNSPMTWENIAITQVKVPLAIGLDSNGSLADNSNTAENAFKNYLFAPSNVGTAGSGPGVLLGSQTFENYFYDGVISGNYGENWATTSCSRSSNVVTCTTPANGLQNGDLFYMRGQANLSFQTMGNLTVDSSTQFHFSQTGPNATTTGGHVFTCRSAAICGNNQGAMQGAPYIYGDLHTNNGGIMIQGMGTSIISTYIDHIVSEDLPSDSALLVVNGVNTTQVSISGLTDVLIADSGSNIATVQKFAGSAGFSRQPSPTGSFGGACTPGGGGGQEEGTGYNCSMEQFRNVGFEGTKVVAEWEGLLRAASPALGQLNQYVVSNTNPNHWFAGQTAGYTALSGIAIAGPDGFNDAGETTQNIAPAGTGSLAVNDGDIVIAFAMWEAPNGLSPTGGTGSLGASNHPFIFSTGGGCSVYFEDIAGDASTMGAASGFAQFGGNRGGASPVTNWERAFGVFKLRGTGTCTNVHFEGIADSTHPIALYMPMMYYIPAGTISDAEAAAIAYYGSAAPFQFSSKVAWTPAWLYGRRVGVMQQSSSGVGATPLASSDFSLSSGWGSSASIGSISGTDQGFFATVTAGSSPGANPTITLTFHDGAWPNAPIFSCSPASGGTGTPQLWLVSTTTTTLTSTFNGTPSSGSTYPVSCVGIGK
jgi:hypothetical protein